MEFHLLILYLVVAAAALAQAALFTLHVFENRRFARGRRKGASNLHPIGRAAVFAPCKGGDVELAKNLGMLLDQDYSDYEVNFIVESADDPAYPIIRQAIATYPTVAARIHLVGRATDSGQKVHNLYCATERLGASIRYLAFIDSDARAERSWLRHLISRLDRPDIGAVTGYRWFVPARHSLANHLLSSINAVVASLLGPGGHMFVWGGSWAITRETFTFTGIRDAWRGALSDDLVVTRVLINADRRIEFEPNCLVASPLDMQLPQVFEFLRRQYIIGRFYATKRWAQTLLLVTIVSVVLWGSAIAAVVGLVAGASWWWIPAGVTGLLLASHTFRAWLRQDMARICLPNMAVELRGARRFDLFATPIAGLVNWFGLVSSLFGDTIRWRGNRYQLLPGGKIRFLNRTESELPAVIPLVRPPHFAPQHQTQNRRVA